MAPYSDLMCDFCGDICSYNDMTEFTQSRQCIMQHLNIDRYDYIRAYKLSKKYNLENWCGCDGNGFKMIQNPDLPNPYEDSDVSEDSD